MNRLESDCFRFILNSVVCNVLCHELCSSVYERNNSFNYCLVVLFFNSNLEDSDRKLLCLFVYKSRTSGG